MRTWRNAWQLSREEAEKDLYRGSILYALSLVSLLLDPADWSVSLGFFLLFLGITVFELRILRAERIADDSYLRINAVLCAVMTGIALLICTPAFRTLLNQLLHLFLHWVVTPVLWVLLMGAGLLLTGIFRLIAPLFLLMRFEFLKNLPQFEIPDIAEMMEEEEELQETVLSVSAFLRTALILAAVLAAVLFFLHWLRRREELRSAPGTLHRETIAPAKRTNRPGQRITGIRALYARYLKELKKAGMRIDPAEPSDIVAERADELLGNDCGGRMRRYWLPVRFGKRGEDDLPEARELFRTIRKELKKKHRGGHPAP